jgi:hypothetical protein
VVDENASMPGLAWKENQLALSAAAHRPLWTLATGILHRFPDPTVR